MKRVSLIYIFLLLCLTVAVKESRAQELPGDTTYIRSFDRQNVAEVYPGIYSSRFNFTPQGRRRYDYRLVANSSAYLGTYINYKWASFKYSWAIPGTQLDNNIKMRYTSLVFRFRAAGLTLRPFYNAFNGLLAPPPQAQRPRPRHFELLPDVGFRDAGCDLYYFTNKKRFSSQAANYFSERQVRSAGSVIVLTTPSWQRIELKGRVQDRIKDSATSRLLTAAPQWISLISRVGYTYNFSFQQGKWNIVPAFLVGGGGLHELHAPHRSLRPATDMQAWVTMGYNEERCYFYVNGWWDNLRTSLFIKDLHRVNTDLSITAGYRFHSSRKKILGVI